MKKLILIFVLLISVSCSKDDPNSDNNPIETTQYVSKIKNTTNSGNVIEIDFIYDENNNLVKTDTDTYYRDFIYSNNRISQIQSITKPSTPYYTIDFTYNTDGSLVGVKRDNHHNGTVFYTTYEYTNGRVTKVCTYTSEADYNQGACDRSYTIDYTDNTNNFAAKVLSLNGLNGATILEPAGFIYDTMKRPYFGESVERVRIPYSTDGTGMDWEINYQTNNPTSKIIVTDLNTGDFALRRDYQYEYNSDDRPTKMTVNTFDINSGVQTSTFVQEYTYDLR